MFFWRNFFVFFGVFILFTQCSHSLHNSSGEDLEQFHARFQATLTTLGSRLTRGGVGGGRGG